MSTRGSYTFDTLDDFFASDLARRLKAARRRKWLIAWALYGVTAGTMSGLIQVAIR